MMIIFSFIMEVYQINKPIKHEIKNTVIACVAVLFVMFSFLASVSTGFTYLLSKLTDNVVLRLGLMPEHVIPKLGYGPTYTYKNVNIALFVILNILFGYLAFKLINQRDTRLSGWAYATIMSLVLLIGGSIFTVLSGDPFNWIAVIFGFPVTFLIQALLATVLLSRTR